jgi:hypothetical protein
MTFSQTMAAGLAVAALAAAGSVDTCRVDLAEPGAPQLEFTVLGQSQGGAGEAPQVDSVSAGQVVLRGVIGTPTPCYTIEADLEQDGSTLTVSLEATDQGGICIQVLGAFAYRARLHGLSAGSHTIAVTAAYPGTGWQTRADTLQVEIP